MSSDLVALRDRREQVIAKLSDAFARDLLDVDEFERRLGVAHSTEAVAELDKLVADLAASAAPTTALVPARTASPDRVRDKATVVALMGGAMREGSWTPARKTRVVAVMGGVELDFREAHLAPGVTEVVANALMGGVHIIVPPHLAVEMDGSAIMGGFDSSARAPAHLDPDRPLLRVSGIAMMGGVHIETRLPGESERDAHRRRRSERKALKAQRRAALPPHTDES
jgi:hypothetical protein